MISSADRCISSRTIRTFLTSSALIVLFAFVPTLNPIHAALSCDQQQPLNTQFRPSTAGASGAWQSGADLTAQKLTVGATIDVNCFTKNGSAQLESGAIDVTNPQGQTIRISDTAQVSGFPIVSTGQYTFVCRSKTVTNCSDSDTFFVPSATQTQPTPTPTPKVSPSPSPTPSPSPVPTPIIEQRSTCKSLRVVGGNDSLVPARVTLRASGSDNKGNIQKYRFFFGTGDQQETDQPEVTYEYKSSGSFIARADVKDSQGNWKTSTACETTVTVRAASIESHKAACADLFVSANNQAKTPSTVKFDVTGYDNKGGLQGYKLDFGNGIVKESTGRTFEQVYTEPGTYAVKAYVKDSQGEWRGGSENCQRVISIASATKLTSQPSTGTPTIIPLFGAGSGIAGIIVEFVRRHRGK